MRAKPITNGLGRHDASRCRVLFASVAPVFTMCVIAIVLTGWGRDGTTGIQIVKHWGGIVIAQAEASSEGFQRPRSAMATGEADAVLALE